MKYFLLALCAIFLLSAGCSNTKIRGEIPTSPKESYEPLPR